MFYRILEVLGACGTAKFILPKIANSSTQAHLTEDAGRVRHYPSSSFTLLTPMKSGDMGVQGAYTYP